MNTPYMTVYLVISLPNIPYIHRIYMVLANPKYSVCTVCLAGKSPNVPEGVDGANVLKCDFFDADHV